MFRLWHRVMTPCLASPTLVNHQLVEPFYPLSLLWPRAVASVRCLLRLITCVRVEKRTLSRSVQFTLWSPESLTKLKPNSPCDKTGAMAYVTFQPTGPQTTPKSQSNYPPIPRNLEGMLKLVTCALGRFLLLANAIQRFGV